MLIKFGVMGLDTVHHSMQRVYASIPVAWGDEEPDPSRMNYNADIGCPTPVGVYARGATPEGILDLAGNVDEWVQDEWHNSYKKAPDDGKAWADARKTGASRVIRGGSWDDGAGYCRSAFRYGGEPGDRDVIRGFRLSRSVP